MKDTSLTLEVDHDLGLRLFLDSLTDQAVITVNPEGIIMTWNEGCRRMKGYSSAEAIGQHFRILYIPEDRALGRPESNLRDALEHGRHHEEWLRRRKNGDAFMAEVFMYPILDHGRLTGYAKVVCDISERKRIEKERDELGERLKVSNLELEGFCYSISHDLRAPIRSIVLRARILEEDFGTNLPAEARAHVDAMARSGLRLASLVDDLLAFARLGQEKIRRQRIDASSLLRHLVAELKPHCHDGQSSFEIQEGVFADADKSMFELVVRNLLENSCKYSEPGVRISFGVDVLDGEAIYFVRDSGIGFDMRYVDKVFEPFQRLHGNDAYSGTGIGLANVRRIVERHGGRIWANSEPGVGTTFYFTLA